MSILGSAFGNKICIFGPWVFIVFIVDLYLISVKQMEQYHPIRCALLLVMIQCVFSKVNGTNTCLVLSRLLLVDQHMRHFSTLSNEGSDEPAQMRRLSRVFDAW